MRFRNVLVVGALAMACSSSTSSSGRTDDVCERTCATCNYGCYSDCAQDSDCAGLCDSKGNALECNALQAGQTARVYGGLS